MDDLTTAEEWLGGMLAKMEPASRRKLMQDVVRELRRDQAKRIAEQRNPDGSAFEPRKKGKDLRGKRGRIKRRAMFAKLRTARFFKMETTASSLAVGFAGRVARLAKIHQLGETAEVAPGGVSYKYPARVLLGFTDETRDMIADKALEHLAK